MNFVSRPGLFSYGRFDNGSRALLEVAELQPGDIVIRDGAPPQAAPAARAGHFLDRAL